MPIDPAFLTPGGALQSALLGRALQRIGGAEALTTGTLIGPYRIEHELGRGGMAVVYLAHRADGEFEQSVALKLVRPDGDSEFAQALLRKERQILASLQHPCIARLLDGGRSADGELWFALELVHGTRIDRYCHERRLPLQRRLALFAQLCEAVQFAHSRLLIHRDIKPANILVTREETVKLLDFGIAQLLAPGADDALAQGALTPNYASPEQLRGEPATTTSDIYQLGRVLQSMLVPRSGAAEDEGENVATQSTTLQPLDPQRDPDAVSMALPGDLAAIIAKALQPLPAQRYATAAELKLDIENFLSHRPTLAVGGGAAYRFGCFLRRHRWSSVATFVAIVAFVATVTMFTFRLAAERDQARASALAAQQAAARANQVRDFLVGMFKVADPNVNRGDKLTATQILERGAADVDKALAGQVALQANLLLVIGEVYSSLGDYPRAEPLLARSVALNRGPAGGDAAQLAHALREYAYAEHKVDKFEQARDLLIEAERLLRADPQAQSELAAVLDQKGLAQKHLNDPDGALASHQAALAAARAAHDDARVAVVEDHFGLLLYSIDRYAQAQAAYEDALRLARRMFGERNTRTAAIEENLAAVLSAQKHYDEALQLMQSAATTERELIGEDNGDYPQTLNMLGNIYADAGRNTEAAESYQAALAITRRTGRGESADAASILSNLGSVYAEDKRYAEARRCLEQALTLRGKLGGADDIEMAHTQTALAQIDLAENQPRQAERNARAALAKLSGKLQPDHEYVADIVIALARALVAQGRTGEARAALEKARADAHSQPGDEFSRKLEEVGAVLPPAEAAATR